MLIGDGDQAPPFDLAATGNRRVRLADHAGRKLVLYFYPKADTSGCTKEACAFQDALPALGKLGLDVVGVSKDGLDALEAFAAKYGLAFPLASDPDGAVVERYGAWVEKSMYGRAYMGIDRSTFLIGADGTILRSWRKVKVPGHAAAVMVAAA